MNTCSITGYIMTTGWNITSRTETSWLRWDCAFGIIYRKAGIVRAVGPNETSHIHRSTLLFVDTVTCFIDVYAFSSKMDAPGRSRRTNTLLCYTLTLCQHVEVNVGGLDSLFSVIIIHRKGSCVTCVICRLHYDRK